MTRTTTRRTTNAKKKRNPRIAIRKTRAGGYRVTDDPRTYAWYGDAFDAAWRACLRRRADLYALTPDGRWVPLNTAAHLRAYERAR